MSFLALIVAAYVALTRLQRVAWVLHRLALAALVAVVWAVAMVARCD